MQTQKKRIPKGERYHAVMLKASELASSTRTKVTDLPSTYFVLNSRAGMVKIGQSRDVYTRLKALQTGSPDVLKIIAIIPLGDIGFPIIFLKKTDMGYTEESLHLRFAKDRLVGEWFTYNAEVKAFVQQLYEAGL